MVNEATRSIDDSRANECGKDWKQDWPDLTNVQFYVYGASASDKQLLGLLAVTCGTVQRYFNALLMPTWANVMEMEKALEFPGDGLAVKRVPFRDERYVSPVTGIKTTAS